MGRLEVVADGPWSSANRSNWNWEVGGGLSGPDYDPGLDVCALWHQEIFISNDPLIGVSNTFCGFVFTVEGGRPTGGGSGARRTFCMVLQQLQKIKPSPLSINP